MTHMPLKVVHLASGDLWAGAEVQLYYLARELHRRGDVALHVILLNHGELEDKLQRADVSVEVLDEQRLGTLRLWFALRQRLKALRPHLIHSHRYKENLLAALAARGTGALSVRSVHSTFRPPASLRAHATRLADTFAARLQSAAVCVSPELHDEVRARFPHLTVTVIENGIDFDELNANARAPIDETELVGGALRIGFVGRMVPIKRPDLFLAAAHHLVCDYPGRFAFYLFGDGPLLGGCADFIARHKLAEQVRLLGFSPHLPAWLARFDALVLCSDHEGLPMVLLEAMALGVPVVAHAVGGMPSVLGCGEYGSLVREQTPRAYIDALRYLADHREETLARAHRARAHLEARYGSAATAERYVTLYRTQVPPPARHRGVVYD